MAVATKALADEQKLRPVALAALRYIAEIDAPNLSQPFSIAHRRDELRDVVHAYQGQPERLRRDAQVRRAPVVEAVPVRLLTQPPAPQIADETDDNATVGEPATLEQKARFRALHGRAARPFVEQLARELEVKHRELANAGAKYGAEANKRNRNAVRVAELWTELDEAARVFSLAEQRLAAERSKPTAQQIAQTQISEGAAL